MTGSTYFKGKGVVGVSSLLVSRPLRSSRTHRRIVVMDSCTLHSSSELFPIWSKANMDQVIKTKPVMMELFVFVQLIPNNRAHCFSYPRKSLDGTAQECIFNLFWYTQHMGHTV